MIGYLIDILDILGALLGDQNWSATGGNYKSIFEQKITEILHIKNCDRFQQLIVIYHLHF